MLHVKLFPFPSRLSQFKSIEICFSKVCLPNKNNKNINFLFRISDAMENKYILNAFDVKIQYTQFYEFLSSHIHTLNLLMYHLD